MTKFLIPLILLFSLSCMKPLDGIYQEKYNDGSHNIRTIDGKSMTLEMYVDGTYCATHYKTIKKYSDRMFLIKNDSSYVYDTINNVMKMTYNDTNTYEFFYKRTINGMEWMSKDNFDWVKSFKIN